jgi:hypothetical protein
MALPKFLIKKGDTTTDVYAQWSIVVTSFPYLTINAKPKNIASVKYYDQNGDYEYIPATITYESQEFLVSFAYKGIKDAANMVIPAFISYISAEISLYYEYAKIGRQKCRIVEILPDPKLFRTGAKDMVEFSIRFKTNDPITNVILSL